MKWTKERPRLGVTHREDFILLTATWWEKNDCWDYTANQIIYDDGYWKWCDLDGDEIGDINDMVADYYMTIPQIKKPLERSEQ